MSRSWKPDPRHAATGSLLNTIMRTWPGAVVTPGELPSPPEALVQRLAAALGTPRPWMRIRDAAKAHSYFEARARAMLAAAPDQLALVEREESAAAQWAAAAPSAEDDEEGGAS
jgi:hypothetical protein